MTKPRSSKKRGGSKKGETKKHLQRAKHENDPTVFESDDEERLKYQTFEEMDSYLCKLAKEGVVFWINEWIDPAFKATTGRKNIAPAWRFCLKAKYALKRDPKTNKVTKYATCSWDRCKCILCDYYCTCSSATTIEQHLKRDHIWDAIGLDLDAQKLFCQATGIDPDDLNQDPQTIEAQEEMKQLIAKYKIDTQAFTNSSMTPQSMKNQPQEIQRKFHEALIELLVGVNASPSSANKRVVVRFIDV